MALSLKRPARYTPRGPRRACELSASLLLADDQVVPVVIQNLSANGFMARCDGAVAANTWLGVELPGCGIVRARVRWNIEGELGCQFRKAIDLDGVQNDFLVGDAAPAIFRKAGRGRARLPRQTQV